MCACVAPAAASSNTLERLSSTVVVLAQQMVSFQDDLKASADLSDLLSPKLHEVQANLLWMKGHIDVAKAQQDLDALERQQREREEEEGGQGNDTTTIRGTLSSPSSSSSSTSGAATTAGE